MESNAQNDGIKIIGYFDFTTTFFKENNPYASVSIIQEEDGIKIKFSFLEEQTKRHTVLIVNPVPRSDLGIENQNTYNCRYISYDSFPLNTYTRDIVVDIDPYLILHNEQYFNDLMGKILRLDRVQRCLTNNAEIPCGNYVGGLYYDNHGGFKERVNPKIANIIDPLYRVKLTENERNAKINRLVEEGKRIEKEKIKARDEYNMYTARESEIYEELGRLRYNPSVQNTSPRTR